MIDFDPVLHRFSTGGREVPGVTSILRQAGAMEGWRVTDDWYATRGRYVHLACAMLDRGTLDWTSLDEHTKPFVECYQQFLAIAKPRIISIEEMIVAPGYRYAGIMDRLIQLPDGTVLVLEIKCGVKQAWHWLQVAAYEDALMTPAGLALLYLNGKGRMPKFLIHPEPGAALQEWRRIIA